MPWSTKARKNHPFSEAARVKKLNAAENIKMIRPCMYIGIPSATSPEVTLSACLCAFFESICPAFCN